MRDAFRRAGGKPLPDGPTQGQAAESKLRNAQNTRQAKNIFAQHLNGIFAFRRIRCSMASYVISQNLEVRKQICYLKLPHSVVGTNRVRQDQDRPPCISLQAVEHSRVPNCCERQNFCSLSLFFSIGVSYQGQSKWLRGPKVLLR